MNGPRPAQPVYMFLAGRGLVAGSSPLGCDESLQLHRCSSVCVLQVCYLGCASWEKGESLFISGVLQCGSTCSLAVGQYCMGGLGGVSLGPADLACVIMDSRCTLGVVLSQTM